MMWIVEVQMKHNGVHVGYRGKNDGMTSREDATQYRSFESASREAQELMEDNAEHVCIVHPA